MTDMPDDWWPDHVFIGAMHHKAERVLHVRRAISNPDQSYLRENLEYIRQALWNELDKADAQSDLQSTNN